ncbi:cilia- and flagella-associated protein 57-like [Hyalella azteca]|uniref:Cilia- and flagella-associated protein 57-like n=1 Tax=Hyalella azteca TaxID=294128 RepID=A0A979FI66_HYAAZ|nr:cilia- and flagella-associated protein 57-like [Hyalella azteca]
MAALPSERQTSSEGASRGSGEVEDVYPKHVFGLRKDVRDAVVHLDSKTVMYPAGAFLVAHNTETHEQTLTALHSRDVPTAMAMSSRRQYLALCLAGAAQDPSGDYIRTEGELPAVAVYDLKCDPIRKVRALVCGDVASHEFVSAAFSADEKVVAVQGGQPDYTLVLFVIEKSKVLSILRLGDTPGLLSVSSVAFHPEDVGVLAVVGRKALRFLRLHDKLLKAYGYQAGLQHMCCTAVWADHYTLLVGTEEGTILLMEEGELKTTIVIDDTHAASGLVLPPCIVIDDTQAASGIVLPPCIVIDDTQAASGLRQG